MDYNPNIMRDIFEKAAALHDGDKDKASEWMTGPNADFHGHAPLSICKPYEGAVKVDQYLTKKLAQKHKP
ncbi:MAG: DUF2384 domain-containing protein [Micavibrio sp.]|nr:MAG: DUF2384 domain-containing protein [Micavibrio sp.]